MTNPVANTLPPPDEYQKEMTRLQRETVQSEKQFSQLVKQIEDEEPWYYSRFTDAVEEGLKCMSRGATYEAMNAVARQKVEMTKDILTKLREFKDCVCSEEANHEMPMHAKMMDGAAGDHFAGIDIDREHPRLVDIEGRRRTTCVRRENYSAEELKSYATAHCTKLMKFKK